MAKYEVSLLKVFGLAITNKTTIEAESVAGARDKVKDAGSYVVGRFMFFSNHIPREAAEINRGE